MAGRGGLPQSTTWRRFRSDGDCEHQGILGRSYGAIPHVVQGAEMTSHFLNLFLTRTTPLSHLLCDDAGMIKTEDRGLMIEDCGGWCPRRNDGRRSKVPSLGKRQPTIGWLWLQNIIRMGIVRLRSLQLAWRKEACGLALDELALELQGLAKRNTDKFAFVRVCPRLFEGP